MDGSTTLTSHKTVRTAPAFCENLRIAMDRRQPVPNEGSFARGSFSPKPSGHEQRQL